MQEEDGPGTDSSWTPWKLLHHQSNDLSPWITESLAIENLRESPVEENTDPSMNLEGERRVRPWIKHWRIYAILAAVICLIILILVPAIVSTKPKPTLSAPPPVPSPLVRFQGIATFNNYAAQGGTVCSNDNKPTTADNVHRFAAAAGDISKDISPGLCDGSSRNMAFPYDTSICTVDGGQAPSSSYQGPACPSVNCGTCYRVDNIGPYGSSSNDTIYGSVIVEIVDACPASHADNYCKTDVPPDERCGSNKTNSLDIDISAYKKLTSGDNGGGIEFGAGQPNLRINIVSNVPCSSTV